MIVVSFLLFLLSLGLLVAGVLRSTFGLVAGSVAASVLAFGALYVGVRQRAGPPLADGLDQVDVTDGAPPGIRATDEPTADEPAADQPASPAEPATGTTGSGDAVAGGDVPGRQPPAGYQLPTDEPPEEPTPAPAALRVAVLDDQVRVVDGRPRYHLATCRHLIGRDAVVLPVCDARQAGFTPCGWCAPDQTLLAGG